MSDRRKIYKISTHHQRSAEGPKHGGNIEEKLYPVKKQRAAQKSTALNIFIPSSLLSSPSSSPLLAQKMPSSSSCKIFCNEPLSKSKKSLAIKVKSIKRETPVSDVESRYETISNLSTYNDEDTDSCLSEDWWTPILNEKYSAAADGQKQQNNTPNPFKTKYDMPVRPHTSMEFTNTSKMEMDRVPYRAAQDSQQLVKKLSKYSPAANYFVHPFIEISSSVKKPEKCKTVKENIQKSSYSSSRPSLHHQQKVSDRLRQVPTNQVEKKSENLAVPVKEKHSELALKKGEIVTLIKEINRNWFEGEINGQAGIFPSNYVDVIFSLDEAKRMANEREGMAVATYDFIGRLPIELSLRKNDEVTLIRKVDENWFEGRLRGRQGLFPASYVQVVKDLSTSSTATNDHKQSEEDMRKFRPVCYKGTIYTSCNNRSSPSILHKNSTENIFHDEKSFSQYDGSLFNPPSKSNIVRYVDEIKNCFTEKCVALYDYKPQNEDELSLRTGDIIRIVEKCDDGWYVGVCEASNLYGTFPGNYVKIIE
ncbi:hypothetical protein HELRODRAFT_167717 [Helobdella robusta]|uniref:SH3 domain-containing protein n=1 Tax=Helobdella robusta TaxID=6412 RepID=T1EZQ1_HELRO|nr:hypothetical protein HELRODRAFT_167717 [Helobdella robusta]ESO09898.1 hypothetical protein HELRODRAFT_167717 [Helobdella robusta]